MSYKKTGKRFISLLVAVLIAFSITVLPVGAVIEKNQAQLQSADTGTISPLWVNVGSLNLSLTFSDKKIYAKVILTAITGTKYKNGTVTLSKYSGGKYVPVKTWTGLSSSRTTFLFSNSDLTAVSGVKYKLSIKITAYTSSKSEVITGKKVATCP